MQKYMKLMSKRWHQQGSILILTAFLLPTIIAFTGMAVDFGNVYVHKAILQDCADASAQGGGEYGVQGGTFVKKNADEKAAELVKHNRKYSLYSEEYLYLDSKSNRGSIHYYTVVLKEKVPMYFLKYFGFENMEIEAAAFKPIKSENRDALSYLFCYSDDLYVVNTIRDNSGFITKNFDGDIVYTNDTTPIDSYDKALNPWDEPKKGHLSGGWTNNRSSGVVNFYRVKDEYAKNVKKSDILEGAPKFVENIKLHVKWLDDKINEQYRMSHTNVSRTVTSKDLDNVNSYYCEDSSVLTIDQPIKGDINEPIYVYVHESDVFQLKIHADSRRPVIICQIKDTRKAWARKGKLHVDGKSGVTFRGIFYVPDCEELNINENNMNFRGTIVSPSIKTKNEGSYKYESFVKNSAGGSSSSASTKGFLSDGDDVVWP